MLYDVIIVGAGYAGLTAAKDFLQAGRSVKIVEARDRVGGRVFTKTLPSGQYVDLGGQWIGPSQDRIYALAREYGVDTFKTWDLGKSTLLWNNKLKRYNGLIPPLPIPALLSLDGGMKAMNKLSKTIDLQAPYLSPKAAHWDGMTLQTWIEKQMWNKTARTMFRIASDVIFAAPPAEISMLHALFYTQSGRDLDTLMNIANGAQEERIMGGAMSIAKKMTDDFPNDTIRYNAPVKRIEQHDLGVRVVGHDFSYEAKRVVVAIPPTLAGRIEYNPALPANRDQLTQRIPMGSVWKCYAIYDQPFWRAEGLNGLAATPDGYISVTFDNSPVDASKGILMGFAVGEAARRMNELSDEKRKNEVLTFLGKCFGTKAQNPEEYIDYSLSNDEYSRGCYAGVMPTGAWTSLGKYLREPCGRIHWAGTETADVWNGYIDGAVRSGERVAKEVFNL